MTRIAIISILLNFFACQKKSEVIFLEDHLPWQSLLLGADTTMIYFNDYFVKTNGEIEIQSRDRLAIHILDTTGAMVVGRLTSPIANLSLLSGQNKRDILIKRPTFADQLFQVPDPEKKFSSVTIMGSFNAWNKNADTLTYNTQLKAWVINKRLNGGQHQYRIVINGIEHLDPLNSDSIANGLGGYNSLLKVGNIEPLQTLRVSIDSQQTLQVEAIMPVYKVLVYGDNHLIAQGNPSKNKFSINLKINQSYSYLRIVAATNNEAFPEVLIPMQNGQPILQTADLDPQGFHSMNMYFLMVDRFVDGNKANNPKLADSVLALAQFLGGDLEGIKQKINEKYFSNLGFNSIWMSPISRNPVGTYGYWDKGGVRTKFTAYHGYWPISYSQIDPRFGTEQDLDELIEMAHQNKQKVILDYVAHHVHQESEVYKKNPNWATSLYLPDGSLNTEKWDEQRLTTWFDVFLPTLELSRPEIYEPISDSALFWVKRFKLDGFRHDATKHVPTPYWQALTRKIRTNKAQNQESFYQIGETYGSYDLINQYIGTGLMQGQFDFNLYDAVIQALAIKSNQESEKIKKLEHLKLGLQNSLKQHGAHHLMGNISGNQDKPRLFSIADGSVRLDEDTKLAGYTRNIQRSADSSAWNRVALVFAFNFSIPGIPIVYYGDEIGMPGANDPDNRRMMQFSGLSKPSARLQNLVSQLAHLRQKEMALVFGTTDVFIHQNSLFICRRYLNQEILTIISLSSQEIQLPDHFKPNSYQKIAGNGVHDQKKLIFNPEEFIILKKTNL